MLKAKHLTVNRPNFTKKSIKDKEDNLILGYTMGHYEDFWWEITESINSKDLKEEFNAQLKKMDRQDKHRYKDAREKWRYAHEKVIKIGKHESNTRKL